MKNFILFFNANEYKVTAFYPYTSLVIDKLLYQSHNYKTAEHDFLDDVWNILWAKAEELGCRLDNKIVLRIEKDNKFDNSPNTVLYLGKKDNMVSLGLSFYQDSWLTERNQYFK